MKILICFGTRPEAIKMSSLVHQLIKNSDFDVNICVTAQHREMLDQVLDFFDLTPQFDLNLMQINQSLNELSGRIFINIDKVLQELVPDIVLVHGDTTSSVICAWAAFHRGIKVGHVEAGLRTHNKFSPFPEELNRQITGKIADFHFAPTTGCAENLKYEKVESDKILVTGNTVIDSLLWTTEKLKNGFTNSSIEYLKQRIDFSKKIILVTAHRRENFGEGFINICKAIVELANTLDVEIVFPVHLNPNVKNPVLQYLSGYKNVHLVDPLDYPSFVWLMNCSYIILTDSGGVQEEGPSLGKPVLVMRNSTERPEAVEAGTVIMVGTEIKKIVDTASNLIKDIDLYKRMSMAYNPYGDGKACERITNYLLTQVC